MNNALLVTLLVALLAQPIVGQSPAAEVRLQAELAAANRETTKIKMQWDALSQAQFACDHGCDHGCDKVKDIWAWYDCVGQCTTQFGPKFDALLKQYDTLTQKMD